MTLFTKIDIDAVKNMMPETDLEQKRAWGSLVGRADQIPMENRPGLTQNSKNVELFEANFMRENGQRLLPKEKGLTSLLKSIVDEVPEHKMLTVPTGDVSFPEPPEFMRPESVPVSHVSGVATWVSGGVRDESLDLRTLAERIASTEPSAGDPSILRRADLRQAMIFTTPDEWGRGIPELRRKYFYPTPSYTEKKSAICVPAYSNPDAGVSIDLIREKQTLLEEGSDKRDPLCNAKLYQRITSRDLSITAPPGSKVLVADLSRNPGSQRVFTVPEDGKLTGSSLACRGRVGFVVLKPADGPGLPSVIDKFILDFPADVSQNSPCQPPPDPLDPTTVAQ